MELCRRVKSVAIHTALLLQVQCDNLGKGVNLCYNVLIWVGLRPEATSEDIYAACRDGDEMFCKEWCMSPDHDLNIT